MKKLLLSTVAVVGFAGIASAADLPRRAIAPIIPIAPAFTWTGFYIGVNAGAAFQTEDDDSDLFGSDSVRLPSGSVRNSAATNGTLTFLDGNGAFGDDDSDVGFSGGGQVGFNYQFTPGSGFVVGVEADIQYIDLGGDDNVRDERGSYRFEGVLGEAFSPPAPLVVRSRREQGLGIDAFGTVRGRLGYAFDRTLIYATGGFAYGFGGDDNSSDFFDNEGLFDNDDDDFKFGYTVGGGVEFALSNFSLFGSSTATFKIEGLYVNLEDDNNNNNGRILANYNAASNTVRLNQRAENRETEFAVVRAGLNFKF